MLDGLIAHGLRTPEFLITDGGAGLDRALAALWRDRHGLHPAVLPLATLVATPYAFGYDLPVITGAALLAVRPGGSVVPPSYLPPPAGNGVRSLLLGCVLMPCAIAVPGAVVVLPVLFAVTLWRIVKR